MIYWHLKTIHDYNQFLGLETLNPLVSFIDFSKVEVLPHAVASVFNFYGIFLKEKIHGPLTYGRSKYDYQEGTLVFVAPGQVAGIDDDGSTPHPQGYALLFHPDLIRGTSLACKMKDYTFFSYEVNEALHMSERERQTVFNCFGEIQEELQHSIDKHSRSIIISNIEVLLNHCLRFYDRQFCLPCRTQQRCIDPLRGAADTIISTRANRKNSGCLRWHGVPTSFISPPTISVTLSRNRQANPPIDYIHQAVIGKVKDRLLETNKTVR